MDKAPDGRSEERTKGPLDLHLLTTRSEQEQLRMLEGVRAWHGGELGAVRVGVAQKLRILQREAGKAKFAGVTQERLDKWRRRQRISGSVTITCRLEPTSTGEEYEITVNCASTEMDKECPNFPPFKSTYGPDRLPQGQQDAANHRDNWVLAVLSELDAELGMELAKANWIDDEFGHQDPASRNADRDVRTSRK